MKNKLIVLGLIIFLIVALCTGFYYLGKSRAEIKIIKEQVQVIKYVDKQKAEIYSKPPADAAAIFKLMRKGLF